MSMLHHKRYSIDPWTLFSNTSCIFRKNQLYDGNCANRIFSLKTEVSKQIIFKEILLFNQIFLALLKSFLIALSHLQKTSKIHFQHLASLRETF